MTENGERYRLLIEASPVAMLVVNDVEGIVYANMAAAHLYGGETVDRLIGRDTVELIHPDDRDAILRRRQEVIQCRCPPISEYAELRYDGRRLRFDGTEFHSESRGIQILWDDIPSVLVIIADITERRHAEQALHRSEERYALAVAGSNDGIWDRDFRTDEDYFSPRWKEILGYREDELDHHKNTFVEKLHPDDRDRVKEAVRAHLEQRAPYDLEFRLRRKQGDYVWVRAKGQAVWDEDGKPSRMAGSISDISERREAERALRESEERYRTHYTSAPVMMHSIDLDGRLISVTDHWLRTLGYQRDEVIGRRVTDFMTEEDRRRAVDEAMPRLFETGSAIDVPYQFVTKTGELINVLLSAIMQRDASGTNECSLTVMIDVTGQKRAEEQLRQAQKMEAVGQLTGGIAHDFNNLLTVVQGNLEMLSEDSVDPARARTLTAAALRAAERGAVLTRRLLAFSRKQTLHPEGVNLGELMSDMTALLRRTLGETIEIDLRIVDGLWHALADPGQVEAALLNLALNARDAMAAGGTLTIDISNILFDDENGETPADIVPGEYIESSVSDTGVGMPAEILQHIFEPFYTTKEVGEGSGLGLSMVYGFAKQSGGHVTVDSEVGLGTTVRLYLPRAPRESRPLEPDAARDPPRADKETILVVEDDPDVRLLVVTLLAGLGYEVLQAGDGSSAIAAMNSGVRIDLLFTDVVLAGGMSGPEVAEQAKRIRPATRILFMSGYPSETMIRSGELEKGAPLLDKPFRKADLARKVREVLRDDP